MSPSNLPGRPRSSLEVLVLVPCSPPGSRDSWEVSCYFFWKHLLFHLICKWWPLGGNTFQLAGECEAMSLKRLLEEFYNLRWLSKTQLVVKITENLSNIVPTIIPISEITYQRDEITCLWSLTWDESKIMLLNTSLYCLYCQAIWPLPRLKSWKLHLPAPHSKNQYKYLTLDWYSLDFAICPLLPIVWLHTRPSTTKPFFGMHWI